MKRTEDSLRDLWNSIKHVNIQIIGIPYFPGGSDSKASATMWETRIQSPGREDLLEKERQPTPVFLSGKSHGRRSPVGYSPWGCKESEVTERLHFHFQKKRKRKGMRKFLKRLQFKISPTWKRKQSIKSKRCKESDTTEQLI